MTPSTQAPLTLADLRRQYPGHLLIFRLSATVHVVCRPGEPPHAMSPGEADGEGIRAASSGVPVLIGERMPAGERAVR